uniref:Uncharacterized protein n=1 Tax=Anguilla anguilla TaxID=7936 RepID=A0A0E9RUG7_ANGAN
MCSSHGSRVHIVCLERPVLSLSHMLCFWHDGE